MKLANGMSLINVMTVLSDPVEAAAEADLRYVSDDEPGYTRKRKGTGFAYYSPNGEHVKDADLKARFEALVIPPMWEDVWICINANGHIQATGYDAKERKQYIYHEAWRAVRDRAKFGALVPFGEALPSLRERIERDLRRKGLPKEKLVAAIVKLLETTLIRIGNREYAKQNNSYGLTTMRRKHVDIDGSNLQFDFVGKSGKEHHISLQDKRLAKIVKEAYELPGYELFKYLDEDGEKHVVDSADVNTYLQKTTGQAFTAKDFRTWAATVLAAETLCQGDCPAEVKSRQKVVSTAIKEVAEHLGNTPAVCRSSYVHPLILEAFEGGELQATFETIVKKVRRRKLERMSESEAAVLEFLKEASA